MVEAGSWATAPAPLWSLSRQPCPCGRLAVAGQAYCRVLSGLVRGWRQRAFPVQNPPGKDPAAWQCFCTKELGNKAAFLTPQRPAPPGSSGVVSGFGPPAAPASPGQWAAPAQAPPPALTLQLGAVSGIHRCSSLPAPSRGCWAQETRHLKRLGPPKLPEQWDPTPAGEARGRGMGAGRRQARLLLGTSGLTAGWRLGEQPGSWSACQQRAPRAAHSESSDSRGHLPTGPGRLDGPRPCWSL